MKTRSPEPSSATAAAGPLRHAGVLRRLGWLTLLAFSAKGVVTSALIAWAVFGTTP